MYSDYTDNTLFINRSILKFRAKTSASRAIGRRDERTRQQIISVPTSSAIIFSPMKIAQPKTGQIWFHQGKKQEPYRIVEVLDNATGYESTGEIADPVVIYVQEYDGEVAKKGKRWARDLNDFLENFMVEEK